MRPLVVRGCRVAFAAVVQLDHEVEHAVRCEADADHAERVERETALSLTQREVGERGLGLERADLL